MIGCAYLSYYAHHRTEENNIFSSGTSSDLFITLCLFTPVYKHTASLARGASTEENTDLSEITEKKIAERASAPLILNALRFHITGLRKVHFLEIAWFL